MKIFVVGAGAMGCLFAARLKMAGHHVTLLEIVEERATQINQKGIQVEGVTGDYAVQVPTYARRIHCPPDLVLVCVKSYDTRGAGDTMRPWVRPDTAILTLQNGLGNREILAEIFSQERVLGGVTSEGATVLAPGRIRHAGQGETIIGTEKGKEILVERIVSAFRQAGFFCRAAENVNDLIWGKLIVNVGINALASIIRLRNGRLPHLKGTRRVMEEAVREAVAVARAKNIRLPYSDPLSRVLEVCQATADNIASMLQDVLKERPTEIDSINGAIVREGDALGIPTPVNLTLTSLVQTTQETYGDRIKGF